MNLSRNISLKDFSENLVSLVSDCLACNWFVFQQLCFINKLYDEETKTEKITVIYNQREQ